MDKQAVTTSIEILQAARRPLVIFPEGHISRTDDDIAPMLERTALIVGRRPGAAPERRRLGAWWCTRWRFDTNTSSTSGRPRRRCLTGSKLGLVGG